MAERHIVVDDNVIDSGDIQAIIDPVWESTPTYKGEEMYRENLLKFSKPQQYVYAVWWFLSEVNNGGLYQFFANTTGIVWEDALNGLKDIGLIEIHQILKESIDRFGGTPNKNCMIRLLS